MAYNESADCLQFADSFFCWEEKGAAMGLIVQKFGGSSVRDRERLLRAMRIVRRTWEQGDDVVVVLSAQGDTTDALLARALSLIHI